MNVILYFRFLILNLDFDYFNFDIKGQGMNKIRYLLKYFSLAKVVDMD